MKAQKLFAILTLSLIVAAGVIAKSLPVTISIGRTAIVSGIVLGIAFASGAIVFVIRTRQAEVENQRYRVWLTQSGQGLAIARAIVVDKHAGRISVGSTPGMGTCFTLRLPLCAQAAGTS